MGLHCWRSFIIKHFPRLNNGIKFGQFWFHKYADLQVFIHEIIKPMEIVAKESLERSPLSHFLAWLSSYISNRGSYEEGDTWMYNKNHDCVYVTKSILEMYIPHCKQTGNLHFETLGDLIRCN